MEALIGAWVYGLLRWDWPDSCTSGYRPHVGPRAVSAWWAGVLWICLRGSAQRGVAETRDARRRQTMITGCRLTSHASGTRVDGAGFQHDAVERLINSVRLTEAPHMRKRPKALSGTSARAGRSPEPRRQSLSSAGGGAACPYPRGTGSTASYVRKNFTACRIVGPDDTLRYGDGEAVAWWC